MAHLKALVIQWWHCFELAITNWQTHLSRQEIKSRALKQCLKSVKERTFRASHRIVSFYFSSCQETELSAAVFLYSCLWLAWSCCCWTSCSKRGMVLVQGSHCLLLPTSVRPLCGRPSAPQLWTLDEVRTREGGHRICASDDEVTMLPCNLQSCLIILVVCVPRHRIWRSNHCSFPPAGHSHGQSACSERGLLQTEPAQPHEPHRHSICLCCSDILPGKLLDLMNMKLSSVLRRTGIWTRRPSSVRSSYLKELPLPLRDSGSICPSNQLATVASTTLTPSSSSTPPTSPSSYSLPWYPTCMLSPRCSPHALVAISWLICSALGL